MELNLDLWSEDRVLHEDVEHYKRIIDKLIYSIVTKLENPFVVGLLGQFMYKPRDVHWKVSMIVLTYIKSSFEKGLFYKKHKYVYISAFYILEMQGTKISGSLPSDTICFLEVT